MKKPTWKHLSAKEKEMILVYRGRQETGYDAHKTKDGYWYFWKMGLQDHPKELVQPTIGEAVHAFLKLYLPLSESNQWNAQFHTPIPRK